MTETLISLISIFIGIIGANLAGFIFKKYSFGIVGNSIAGVFGSILFIKSFGRLGLDPKSIMESGSINFYLFTINSFVSFCGGVIALVLIRMLKARIDMTNKKDNG